MAPRQRIFAVPSAGTLFSSGFPKSSYWCCRFLRLTASVGPSFIFLMIAIGVGVCISGLRYFIFEKGIYKKNCLSPIVYRGMGSEKLALVRAFADEHYRYHQFYGGCALALLILFVGWIAHARPTLVQIGYRSVGFILVGLLLERSADNAFTKYNGSFDFVITFSCGSHERKRLIRPDSLRAQRCRSNSRTFRHCIPRKLR
jgi:hypothetical protein